MSDMKDLALAAIDEVEEWKAAGEHWPQWNRRYLEFRHQAQPEDILALLSENESLREQLEDADEQVVALEKQVKALIRASISSPENP